MSKFTFQITAGAVEYLRKNLLRTSSGDPLVLAIVPEVSQEGALNLDANEVNFSDRELVAMATDFMNSLSSPIELHWVVGGVHKSRLPEGNFRLVDGIECFLPEEVRCVVNGRVLSLQNGELRFDPQLEPPHVKINTKKSK